MRMGGVGGCGGVKMETTLLEPQFFKSINIIKKNFLKF